MFGRFKDGDIGLQDLPVQILPTDTLPGVGEGKGGCVEAPNNT